MRAPYIACSAALASLATALAAQQPPAANPADYARQPFVLERFYERARFDSDGTGRTEVEVRVRVQSEAVLQTFGNLEYGYNSANQTLDVDRVRVLKAGGDTVVAPASAVLDVTGAVAREAPMFSDLREKVVAVPGLRPGDVLEYHLTWTTHTPLAPGEFWFATDFQDDAIVLDQRLTLDVPGRMQVLVRTTGVPQPAVSDSGGRRIYEWRHANLRVDTSAAAEARRTSLARHGPHQVQVTTFRGWEDVGRWYAGLEQDRETPTAAIRAKADSLVRGRTTLLDSIAALYDFVSQEFRYVSISLGIGRYQPHASADVLAAEYGDCKDKHALLASLLRAIGVASAPALVSSGKDVDPAAPSPLQFDHLITFVPAGRDTLWLDATPGAAPFRLLTYDLRGRLALVIPLDGTPRLVRTPDLPPFTLFDSIDAQVQIGDAGRLTASYQFSLRGEAETVMRLLFRQTAPEQLNEIATQIAGQSGLAGTASAMHGGDPKATRDPFHFSFNFEASDAITWNNLRASYRPPLPTLRLPEADTTAGDSAYLAPANSVERLRLQLPLGVAAQVPLDTTVSRPFAEYRSSYQLRGSTVTVTRLLSVLRRVVPPDRVRDYVAFRRAVLDDQGKELTLTRTLAAANAAGGSVDAIHQAGWDALQRGDPRAAIELFRQVVKRDPRHQYDWNNLGRAYMSMNRLDSAAAAFAQAISVNPNEQYAYNNLGLAEWRLHHNDSAAASFRRQIAVNPLDRYAHSNLGLLALEMHQDSVAVAEMMLAVGITPNDVSAHIGLGRAYLAAGQADQGFAELQRALAIRPVSNTLNSAAFALAEAGVALDTAERYVRVAIDSTEAPLRDATLDDPGPRSMFAVFMLSPYWDTLGWIYFKRGDLTAAERYLRAAWLMGHADGEIGDHLAQTYERLGRKADAIHTYALAMKSDRTVPETRVHLAALVGGPARADRVATQVARRGFQDMQTVHLPRLTRTSVAGQVVVLLAPGPRVVEVRPEGSSEALKKAADKLRGAGAAFPNYFPDTTAIRIPLRGLLACSPASGCTFTMLGGPGTTGGVIISRPVPVND